MAKISKERLEKVGANILGVVLNKFEASGANGYYNYYYEQDTRVGEEEKDKWNGGWKWNKYLALMKKLMRMQ